jgi:hypothetical protein
VQFSGFLESADKILFLTVGREVGIWKMEGELGGGVKSEVKS